MLIYTINETKEREKNLFFLPAFIEYLKIVSENYGMETDDLQTNHINNNETIFQEVESLRFRFGKGFFIGWSAGVFSIATGVFAWLVAESVNKISKRKKVRIFAN